MATGFRLSARTGFVKAPLEQVLLKRRSNRFCRLWHICMFADHHHHQCLASATLLMILPRQHRHPTRTEPRCMLSFMFRRAQAAILSFRAYDRHNASVVKVPTAPAAPRRPASAGRRGAAQLTHAATRCQTCTQFSALDPDERARQQRPHLPHAPHGVARRDAPHARVAPRRRGRLRRCGAFQPARAPSCRCLTPQAASTANAQQQAPPGQQLVVTVDVAVQACAVALRASFSAALARGPAAERASTGTARASHIILTPCLPSRALLASRAQQPCCSRWPSPAALCRLLAAGASPAAPPAALLDASPRPFKRSSAISATKLLPPDSSIAAAVVPRELSHVNVPHLTCALPASAAANGPKRSMPPTTLSAPRKSASRLRRTCSCANGGSARSNRDASGHLHSASSTVSTCSSGAAAITLSTLRLTVWS